MKKLKYLLFACLGAVTISSCTKLESADYSVIDPSFFPATSSDVSALVTACYKPFSAHWNDGYWCASQKGFHVISDMTTDIMHCQWGDDPWAPITYFTWHADWYHITMFYYRYQHISTLTSTIARIEAIDISDKELKTRYIAELKALRGWLAYMLYDFYGPFTIASLDQLKDPLADLQLPRASEQECQDFIETNLKEAAAVLPPRMKGENYGRASKGLCNMLLLKFYMLTKNWSEAVKMGRELQKPEYGYTLVPNYKDIFTLENEENDEIIQATTATTTINQQQWLAHVLPGSYPTENPALQKWNGYRMTWNFFHTYDSEDKRLETISAEYMGTDGVLYNEENPGANLKKGAIPIKISEDPASTGENSSVDWVIYRYADVLTLLAEAIVRDGGSVTQEAVDLLNVTKHRAGIKEFTLSELSDVDTFLAELLIERGHEFYAEGVRRSDLIRHGKYKQAAIDKGYGDTFREGIFDRFPLPQTIINEGKGEVVQNPGY